MHTRPLGKNGPLVSAIGLGCMGMTDFYTTGGDTREAVATLHRALELGINLLDTADMYGPHTNEALIGHAIRGKRDQVFWPANSASSAILPTRQHAVSAVGPSIFERRLKAA